MGAVAGPLVAAGFVTPVNRATGTTPASTALNALQGENGSAPLLSQRGLTTVARPPLANSAVNSFVSVHVGSLGNFSALELQLEVQTGRLVGPFSQPPPPPLSSM